MMKDQTWMGSRGQGWHVAVRSVREANDGEGFICPGPDNFRVIVDGDKMIQFEGVKPTPMFGELTKDWELIFTNGNARHQDWLVPGQVVIARTESHRDLRLSEHLHPFINIDQLWNDTLWVKHVEQIAGNADQIVAIGDAQKPFKPWFVEMKVGREEEFHVAVSSRRNLGTTKKQTKEVRKNLKRS
jgi:hypothetical protein